MPNPGVSLIPRGSKSTKKKRTSFRPASKKSNQNKSKTAAAAAASAKASKAAAVLNNNVEESSTATTDVAASKLPAQIDSAQTTTAAEKETETTKNNDGANMPLSPASKSTTPQSVSKGGNDRDDDEMGAENETVAASTAKTGSKKAATTSSVRTTRASAAIASAAVKASTRKRKTTSLNKKISIGSSLRRKTEITSNDVSAASPITGNDANSSSEKNLESSTAMVSALTPKDGEGKVNDPSNNKASAAAVLEAKKHALAAAIIATSSNSIVPAFSAHDQAILHQLASEEKAGEGAGKALNSFCTPFKGPKRKLKDNNKDGTKNNSSKSNKDKDTNNGDAAKDSAAANDDTADDDAASASNSNNKSNERKVDASTTGAPSVQIIDGQIVLQESSVVLPSRRTVQEVEEEFRDNVVEEDEQLNIVQASYTSFVTKGDHGKVRKKGSWSIEETEKFYFALQQLGTDFGSMEALFFENQRTRKQLKNKYRRELARNPDIVQELALNPKYQIQLDMTALNLEVDPKRIEAHENEEPPAYEPTDGDDIETTSLAKSRAKLETNGNDNDYNGVFEGEVVEEDAEEERRSEALAAFEGNKTTTKTSTSSSNDQKEDPKELEDGEGSDSGMGDFPRQSGEGPSMDDFFGDSYADDDDPLGNKGGKKGSTADEKEETPLAAAAASKNKKETSQQVSLVPRKTTSKPRRPKIRPSRRKK